MASQCWCWCWCWCACMYRRHRVRPWRLRRCLCIWRQDQLPLHSRRRSGVWWRPHEPQRCAPPRHLVPSLRRHPRTVGPCGTLQTLCVCVGNSRDVHSGQSTAVRSKARDTSSQSPTWSKQLHEELPLAAIELHKEGITRHKAATSKERGTLVDAGVNGRRCSHGGGWGIVRTDTLVCESVEVCSGGGVQSRATPAAVAPSAAQIRTIRPPTTGRSSKRVQCRVLSACCAIACHTSCGLAIHSPVAAFTLMPNVDAATSVAGAMP